jgi:gephyrin
MAKPGVSNQPSQESGHTHHHHHHHHDGHEHRAPQPRTTLSHDPSAPGELCCLRDIDPHRSSSSSVSARHRDSPYPLISLEDALHIIGKVIMRLETISLPVRINSLHYSRST